MPHVDRRNGVNPDAGAPSAMPSHVGCGRAVPRHGGTSLAPLVLVSLLAWAAPAPAQTLDDLSGALGGAKSGGLGALGGGELPSVDQASTGNLAGVLQYCIKNKYLGGSDASSVEQSLLGKAGGAGEAQKDQGFMDGAGGLLDTGGGQSFSLGGDGLQKTVTDKVCDLVLEHAQSML